jgi:hypothetical protein
MNLRTFITAFAFTAASSAPAMAQTQIVVQGRVVERGTSTPLANVSVELDGHPVVVTSGNGQFRFEGVTPGGYSIHAEAFGYTPADAFVVLRQDTTLLIELTVSPLALDTLSVATRRINVRGQVRQSGTDVTLARADVRTNLNRETRTNVAGRFRLRDVPAGVPVLVQVRAFGYLPLDSLVIAERDTSLTFNLEIDALAQRMIARQVSRLEERSRPFRSAIMPAIDRDALLRSNGTILDILESRYSINLKRVRCILIDERQSYNGMQELALYLPEDVERVEVLERGAMLRIYTREFIRKMLGGGVRLARPIYVPDARPPLCK